MHPNSDHFLEIVEAERSLDPFVLDSDFSGALLLMSAFVRAVCRAVLTN